MASTTSSAGARLTIDDWIQAGLETIAEEGLKGVKIDRLCKRLHVTKGSFYWHFEDIDAYWEALGQSYDDLRAEDQRKLADLDELEPRVRLSRMLSHLAGPRQFMLERAVREWSRTDPKMAARIEASDRWVYRMLRKAFLDQGFPRPEAEFRARATFSAGVGFIHLNPSVPDARAAREREMFLDLIMRR